MKQDPTCELVLAVPASCVNDRQVNVLGLDDGALEVDAQTELSVSNAFDGLHVAVF